MTGSSVNSLNAIEVIPSGAALAAEVRGIDLSQPLPDDVQERLTKIWAEHLVLLLRGQELEDADLIRFSDYYGGQQMGGARKKRWEIGMKESGKAASTDARVNYVTNLDKDGNPAQHNRGTGSYELRWHSDNTYVDVPPTGTMLWADVIPDDDSGQTAFCNQIRAYAEMPEDLKALIQGKHMMHDGSRNTANLVHPHREMPKMQDDIDGPVHPMVRVHPPTGKHALFLGRRWDFPSTYIVEMPNDEGEDLMDRLWAHATQDKYVWTHHWKRGDFILWDNRAVMHRRTAINSNQPRILHRTMIKGVPVVAAWENDAAAD